MAANVSNFGVDRQRPDGLAIYCRRCRHEIYLERGTAQTYRRFPLKRCERCGEEYQPTGPTQRFCSVRCRAKLPTACVQCGVLFKPSDRSQQKYCSRACFRLSFVGRTINAAGYMRITVPTGTPGQGKDGRMLEHRFVMQEHLSRPLATSENVHHINGDKTDNRIENLELWTRPQPKGVRSAEQGFVCLDCGSHNVEAVKIG